MKIEGESNYFKTILNAMPVPVFVVDGEMQIMDVYEAAMAVAGPDPSLVLQMRGGEALNCLNADESGRCGLSLFCKDCVIRNSVTKSLHGERVTRRASRMNLVRRGRTEEVYMLVTTSVFAFAKSKFVLLILEDISELAELRSMVPICASCKKIRNDQEYWEHLEEYFKKQWDLDFTHSICPDCFRKLYPDLKLPV
jgi:PAS domain-containing protein